MPQKTGKIMKRSQALVYIVAFGAGMHALFMSAGLALSQPCEQWAAKVVSVQGAVQARQAGEISWTQVRLNQTFCPGDIIRVLKNSRAAISLANDTLIRVDQNTTISVTGIEKENTFFLDLIRGAAHFFSRFRRKFRVSTPFVNAAVEGTEFYVRVEDDQTFLSIFEGRVAIANAYGGLAVSAGQAAIALAGKAPVLHAVINPRDAVQWALYYPPIIDWRPIDFAGGQETEWQEMVRKSIEYYWQGDLVGAFSVLEKAPEDIRDPRFYLYRAALFLTVGRVGTAQKDVTTALHLDPSNSYAVALQSIISVVQNEKDRALELANRSVRLDPQSSTALVALSYARQAQFDIQGALDSLRKAVELGPENALAWSRLAELYLSVGELTKAGRAANKAVTLNPGLARTQTVLGFTLIDRVKIKAAKETFNKAIELDSAAPLPRLGFGLAKIRGGDLEEGRAEIEIAACLDPNNSLIRSYLGKAYYEEKRDKPAGAQYAIAKELDPLDPTPWFYDAIRKQTINRPVEALQDMQKSIELNDNRAVYRSRLLLDEDLAARSAGLGRIYNDLGFQQLGLIEGWKSVNSTPASYSAHRLLADLYAAVPRLEIARVSELLQSQLLQPINITPVQPLLAESDLRILESAGPSDPSFNEFNPLFLRNRFAMQASAVTGGNDTVGDELVHSAVWNQLSYSLGQFYYHTNGFRENNDQEQNILDAFTQVSITPNTSIQGEVRRRTIDNGQLDLLFDPEISPDFRRKQEADIYRFGFHHAFSPESDVIGSVIYQDVGIKQHQVSGDPLVDTDFKENRDGYIAEMQHLIKWSRFNLASGAGHIEQDFKQKITFDILPTTLPPPLPDLPPIVLDPDPDTIKGDGDIRRTNIYAYSQTEIFNSLIFTAGLSADFLKIAKQVDSNQINPKLGLIWNLLPGTTFRGAVFRERGLRLNFNQSIEPTQVAGFNQFFDDINGTDFWRYAAAIDQTFSSYLFGGIEYSVRDLDVPRLSDPDSSADYFNWREKFGRAYLYWTVDPWIALSAEYQYERLDREDEPLRLGIVDVTTQRVPLGFNFFHPSGLSVLLSGTYINQSGNFQKRDSDEEFSGDDDFWLLDTSINYRLPARHGMVSVGAKNLLNTNFRFQDADPENPRFIPERFVFARFTLSF
jgi:tetratricopeptide (TPR) repeat protein